MRQEVKDRIYQIKADHDKMEIPQWLEGVVGASHKILVTSYTADLQIQLATTYAEAIRDGEITNCEEVQWKGEISTNLFAVYKMLNIIQDIERCKQLLRAIIDSWSSGVPYQIKYKNKPVVIEFLDKIMGELQHYNTDDKKLAFIVSEQYPILLKMFKNNAKLLNDFFIYISPSLGKPRSQNIVCKHIWYLWKMEAIVAKNRREIFNALTGIGCYSATEEAFNGCIRGLDREEPRNDFSSKPTVKQISQFYPQL